MARSKWKNKFFNKFLWSEIFYLFSNNNFKHFKKLSYFRNSQIPRCFLGKKVYLHKGKIFNKIFINNYVVGLKFGEFSYTRKPFFFPKKDQKKKR